MESLLQPQKNRFTMFPITYPDIWEAKKRAEATFWTAEEIKMDEDKVHWEKRLDNKERHFIKYVLAFFAASDGIVLENLAERFMKDIQIPEVRAFYGYQIHIENTHSETYSLLIDTYITDEKEKDRLFNAIENIPSVQQKANWALKWIDDESSNFPTRLIAFAIVEGIFFSSSFCAIYWLKQQSLMPGLTFSNELISRDEGMHTDFAVLLYSKIKNRIDDSVVYSMFQEAVDIEKEFISEALPWNLKGMNAKLMCEYIEFVADRLLIQLGYDKKWGTANPFSFMELISLRAKTNFFERRVGEYVKAGVGKTKDDNKLEYTDDF